MNYRKQFNKIMHSRQDNSVMTGFALIGGIAIGTALSILFAPKKGTRLREEITEGGHRLCDTLSAFTDSLKTRFIAAKSPMDASGSDDENNADKNPPAKKPKSDIGEFIQQAHQNSNEPQNG